MAASTRFGCGGVTVFRALFLALIIRGAPTGDAQNLRTL